MIYVELAGAFLAGGAVGALAGFLWGRSGKAAAAVQAATADEVAADTTAEAERKKIEQDTAAAIARVPTETPEQVMQEMENMK